MTFYTIMQKLICFYEAFKIIIIVYSGYPLHRSVFQWGPAKIMYNTVTIHCDTIRYDTRYDMIIYGYDMFIYELEKNWASCQVTA